MSKKQLKICFHPCDGAGHLSATTGLAETLRQRGHRIAFAVHSAYAGRFCALGFEEYLLFENSKPTVSNDTSSGEISDKNPVKAVAQVLLSKLNLLNGKSSLQKMLDRPPVEQDQFMIQMIKKMIAFDQQLQNAFDQYAPDLIVIDHFLIPPAVARSNVPWISVMSANPIPAYNTKAIPPFGSGFATNADQHSDWNKFHQLVHKIFVGRHEFYQMQLCRHFDYQPSAAEKLTIESEIFPKSPYLNIYGYPRELDYDDIVPQPDGYVRVDSFHLPAANDQFAAILPPNFYDFNQLDAVNKAKIIYFSLGSMGSIDVELMRRILRVFALTRHRYIVSMGPRADEVAPLPANCWGEANLPQCQILPHVHLVITHGGNNTVTETFACGKPMIVLPLFGDQYDNAQRIAERGFGIRLNPYSFTDNEMIESIERLLDDHDLHRRLLAAAERISTEKSKEKVCQIIEKLA